MAVLGAVFQQSANSIWNHFTTATGKEEKMSLKKLFLIALCVTAVLLIIIPSIQAEYPEGSSEEKININTASYTDFVKLRGVTLKHARRIIAYRNENGPFLAPEDIVNVPGIGPRAWELNKDRIVVEDEAPDRASEN